MSRLERFILRLKAQRNCLDAAAALLAGLDGPILELGLGSGRTYDHLRDRFPDREIFDIILPSAGPSSSRFR